MPVWLKCNTTMKKIAVLAIMAGVMVLCHACDDPEGPPDPVIEPTITKAVIDPAVTYQEMIGPEAENIGYSSKLGGNTFAVFSDPLKNKSSLAAYAYHTYNFPASALIAQTKADLNMIRDTYGNKPCIMSEYSNFTWLNTAWFIIQNLNEANAAGYIYWLMAWADSNNDSMIKLSSAGAYTLTPFYYVMKHFSKEIDKGYVRIKVLSPLMPMSGFIDPSGKKITVVAVNPNTDAVNYEFEVTGKTVKSIRAMQTDAVNSYKDTQPVGIDKYIILKPKSVTTIVLELQ